MLTDPDAIRRFALAGNATFTLSSKRTGARYTYRASAPKDAADRFFLSLLTGPDNEADYTYIGMITPERRFTLTRASKMGMDAAPVRAAAYFCQQVLQEGRLPDALEVRHEGKCGRCGRKLTVPESVDSGIGPECAKVMA